MMSSHFPTNLKPSVGYGDIVTALVQKSSFRKKKREREREQFYCSLYPGDFGQAYFESTTLWAWKPGPRKAQRTLGHLT
jgi:hypothetical protein